MDVRLDSYKSFITELESLPHEPEKHYLVATKAPFPTYSLSKTQKGSLSTNKIDQVANEALFFLNRTVPLPVLEKVDLLKALETGLSSYATCVEKSARNRWWVRLLARIGIHSIFGHPLAQKPENIVLLQKTVRENIERMKLSVIRQQQKEKEKLEQNKLALDEKLQRLDMEEKEEERIAKDMRLQDEAKRLAKEKVRETGQKKYVRLIEKWYKMLEANLQKIRGSSGKKLSENELEAVFNDSYCTILPAIEKYVLETKFSPMSDLSSFYCECPRAKELDNKIDSLEKKLREAILARYRELYPKSSHS